MRMNIVLDSAIPIIHASFLGAALTYSGTWLRTIQRLTMSVGEKRGLTKTRITKSARKAEMTNLMGTKLPAKTMNMSERNVAKNSRPAAPRISRSLRTGMRNPSTCSPNRPAVATLSLRD
jgi:hypothetical protein